MNDGATGIVVLGAIVLICSIAMHTLQKKYWHAVLLSACVSAVLFQIVSFMNQGYLDPFFIIAVFVTFGIGAIGSIIIGFLFHLKRNKTVGDNTIAPSLNMRNSENDENKSI